MDKPSTQTPRAEELRIENPARKPPGEHTASKRLAGPTVLAALAGVAAAAGADDKYLHSSQGYFVDRAGS